MISRTDSNKIRSS